MSDMSQEQAIQTELTAAYPCLQDTVRIQRARRLYAAVPRERIGEVFAFVVRKMDFSMLCAITGLDEGETLGVIYHLARPDGTMLNLSASVPKERPILRSVTGFFPAADAYERELIDLLGFQVEGLGPGPHYPLPDDWPAGQYPLRKDWTAPDQAGPPRQGSENPDV